MKIYKKGASNFNHIRLSGYNVMVRHIKSISCSVLAFEGVWADQVDTHSFPWSCYDEFRGEFPILKFMSFICLARLVVLTYDRTFLLIFVQYIAALIVSSRRLYPGCCR